MEKKGQLDFEPEMLFAAGLGLIGGIVSLVVMKGSPTGAFWKIVTFLFATVAGGIVSYLIFTKD